MTPEEFKEYIEEHSLVETEHEQIWWTHSPPDNRAYSSAEKVAESFPELKIVGTESRMQLRDVKWNLDGNVLIISYYPIRADMWTQETISDVEEALA